MMALSYILFTLFFLEVLAQDICHEKSLEIHEVLREQNQLFLFMKRGNVYIVEDFEWDGTNFVYSNISFVNPRAFPSDLKLIFSAVFPGIGKGIIAIKWGTVDSIDQMLAYVLSVNAKGDMKWNEININLYKCGSRVEPLRLCSLFAKFPEEDMHKQMLSLSSFPVSIDKLPERVFVYYKEVKSQRPRSPYKMKRYIYVKKTMSIDNLHQVEWVIDNSTGAKCDDLNGVIINASSALTEYKQNGNQYDFDWIEFFGTQFNILRVSVTKQKVLEDIKLLKTGLITDLFGLQKYCPPTTQLSITELAAKWLKKCTKGRTKYFKDN